LVAEERDRAMVRTAALLEGKVWQTFDQGALVQLSHEMIAPESNEPKLAIGGESRPERVPSGKTVYVAGLIDAAEGARVSVFGHASGVFRFTADEGKTRVVEKYNFYRAAAK
jgi:hypothetical protein